MASGKKEVSMCVRFLLALDQHCLILKKILRKLSQPTCILFTEKITHIHTLSVLKAGINMSCSPTNSQTMGAVNLPAYTSTTQTH